MGSKSRGKKKNKDSDKDMNMDKDKTLEYVQGLVEEAANVQELFKEHLEAGNLGKLAQLLDKTRNRTDKQKMAIALLYHSAYEG